ncbi:hypothetical protein ACHAWT_001371 [Skeletonema menzelii]|mmetsp:Transcript_22321/g.36708  ORF Transcript_22321/g.36708 Transcript_22321/m.36708 type:complete len:369 (+) Transcript_22321:147-1253(+)|eukprot:scaffold4266_cov139-Skeletonema_menzelii.AAC.10
MIRTTNRKKVQQRRRSGHISDVSRQDVKRTDDHEEALKNELARMEATDSQWDPPMGFGLFQALRILNAPVDPLLTKNGHWIQPEDLDDIPAMYDSYLNVNCLYYSLVGVLAIETSLFLEVPPENASTACKWLITVSRATWCANGVWSMAAVVGAFHTLWALYATPRWARRNFIFQNARTIASVYVLGAPNFALMLIGTITGVFGNILAQEGYETRDWVAAAIGLGLGLSVAVVFILCSGSLIAKVIRPWKLANDHLVKAKRRHSDTGVSIDAFYDNYEYGNVANDKMNEPDFEIPDVHAAGLAGLNMTAVSHLLTDAGLTLEKMQRVVNNEVLLDNLIKSAGVDKAGDRLEVILYVRDAEVVPSSVET